MTSQRENKNENLHLIVWKASPWLGTLQLSLATLAFRKLLPSFNSRISDPMPRRSVIVNIINYQIFFTLLFYPKQVITLFSSSFLPFLFTLNLINCDSRNLFNEKKIENEIEMNFKKIRLIYLLDSLSAFSFTLSPFSQISQLSQILLLSLAHFVGYFNFSLVFHIF